MNSTAPNLHTTIKVETTMKTSQKQMGTGIKVCQEEMKATASTGWVNVKATINSIRSELEETNYRAEDCLRGIAYTVRPADSFMENPPPSWEKL